MINKIRIVLVDDHGVVREGVKRLLENQPDMEVVGEAGESSGAIQAVERLRPDLVMMDVSMPEVNGIEATRLLKETSPEVKVLALTVHEDPGYVSEFLKAGASGYLLKRTPTEELVRAVRTVSSGELYVDPRVSDSLVKSLIQSGGSASHSITALSDREEHVLRLTALGYANKEIAAQLGLSVKTVETYKARSMEKLGLSSRVDIVRVAAERGWLKRSGS